MSVRILTLRGAQTQDYIPNVGRLRIQVFREYPYLYEGTLAYEQKYLRELAGSESAVLVLAIDDERTADSVVGVSTALSATEAELSLSSPLAQAGFDLSQVFYFGESVLLPEYRGQGIGHRFFDERERAAGDAGATLLTFAEVDRKPDDPRRPAGYRPHDAFWTKRGYKKHPEIRAQLSWPEVGLGDQQNTLIYWLRRL